MDLSELVDDTKFLRKLMRLQECVCEALAEANGPSLCFCGLVPSGRPPIGLMNCKDASCGIAWITPIAAFPYGIFPQPADPSAQAGCNPSLAMRVTIGIARCYPRATNTGTLDPQDAFNTMRLYLSDAAAVKKAILCCFPDQTNDDIVALEGWEALPPEASVSGGTWTVVIG